MEDIQYKTENINFEDKDFLENLLENSNYLKIKDVVKEVCDEEGLQLKGAFERDIINDVERSIINLVKNDFYTNIASENVNNAIWKKPDNPDINQCVYCFSANESTEYSLSLDIPLEASIIIECIFLFVGLFGIKIPGNQKTYKAAYGVVKESISTVKYLIIKIKNATSNMNKAKYIFQMIYELGFKKIFSVVKAALSDLPWYEWAKISAILTLTVASAILTGGAAVIAKIAISLIDAISLVQKIIAYKDK